MKFKVEFEIAAQPHVEKWPSFFMMGSCFATHQATRMKSLGFHIQSNPFGILYNPISIEHTIERSCTARLYESTDFEHRKDYFCWEHHGDHKYALLDEAIAHSNELLRTTKSHIAAADTILITYGTSLVYTRANHVVANCHKVTHTEFIQKQLSFTEVKQSIQRTIHYLQGINPTANILFTVSPIRHLRSGVVESSRSKAVLLAALQETVAADPSVSYFPSFEIFIDELRDYRFAKEDMTHPTAQAEQYIWERFCATFFSVETQQIVIEVQKYLKLAAHRPIHTQQLHEQRVNEKLSLLKTKYPFLQLK